MVCFIWQQVSLTYNLYNFVWYIGLHIHSCQAPENTRSGPRYQGQISLGNMGINTIKQTLFFFSTGYLRALNMYHALCIPKKGLYHISFIPKCTFSPHFDIFEIRMHQPIVVSQKTAAAEHMHYNLQSGWRWLRRKSPGQEWTMFF